MDAYKKPHSPGSQVLVDPPILGQGVPGKQGGILPGVKSDALAFAIEHDGAESMRTDRLFGAKDNAPVFLSGSARLVEATLGIK